MFAGCGQTSSNTSSAASKSEPVKVVIAAESFNTIPNDLSKIDNALNKLLEKENITVDLQLYGPADYATKTNLALESGTQLDLFLPQNFATAVSKKQALAMDDLLTQYGKASKDILAKDFGADALKSVTINGHIYGLPVNRGQAVPLFFIYNSDMMKETGIDPSSIKTVEDLPKVFDAVKAKNPNVTCMSPLNINPCDSMITYYLRYKNNIDYLTDTTGTGVVVGSSGKVVDLYETDLFKNAANLMRSWYKKGYFAKDVATTTTDFGSLFRSGKAFSTLGGYNWSAAAVGQLFQKMSGKNCGAVQLTNFYFDTSATQLAWVISSTSKHPDAAMKLLNATMTDSSVLNTILYGIEGEDYVKVDSNHVSFPKGKTESTVPYTAYLTSGQLGSESLQWMFEDGDVKEKELKVKLNKETPRSPYFGFTFDQSAVKTEMSAIQNVYNQYYSGLVCGSVDPATTIPKFVKALKDAGMDTVIQAKQEQLDKWIAEQKK